MPSRHNTGPQSGRIERNIAPALANMTEGKIFDEATVKCCAYPKYLLNEFLGKATDNGASISLRPERANDTLILLNGTGTSSESRVDLVHKVTVLVGRMR